MAANLAELDAQPLQAFRESRRCGGGAAAVFQLARACFDRGRDRQALEYCRQALELDPGHSPSLLLSAFAFAMIGKDAEARRRLDGFCESGSEADPSVIGGRQLLESLDEGIAGHCSLGATGFARCG